MNETNVPAGFSRERLEEIWARVMPKDPPPAEVFDSLLEPFEPTAEFAADYLPPPRVEVATAPVKNDAGGITPALIDRELALVGAYCELGRVAPSKQAARTLSEMSNEQYANAKSAAVTYFFETGNYHFPETRRTCDRPQDGVGGYRPRLRAAWQEERNLAARYIDIADHMPSDGEAGMLTIAHTHARHALMIRALLEENFG